MKIDVAVTVLKGVRVAVAFPPPAWVVPGMGDALLATLQPQGVRTHAAFQSDALAEGADLDASQGIEINLGCLPMAPDDPPPF